jgi:membrane protease YdiL (CAAX protease family)
MGANQAGAVHASPPPIVRTALVFYAVLFGAAVLWSRLADHPLGWASAEAAQRGVDPRVDVGAGALVGLAFVLASGVWTRATRSGERLARALAAALGPLRARECLILALASGVAEEAFFRGAMQPQLGLFATSALFALAHFVPRRDLLPWAAFSLVAGLALGLLFDRTGNLVAPVVAHALVNGVNLRLLVRDYAPV